MARAAAIGMFDGVHLGHQALIADLRREAQAIGATPMAVTFDQHPKRLIRPDHAPALITTVADRCQLLLHYGCEIVETLTFDDGLRQLTARQFMQWLHDAHDVRLIVLGFNHRFGSDRISDFEHYRHIGQEIGIDVKQSAELVINGIDRPVSSSQIRHALVDGDIAMANAMLGRRFSLAGTVAHGKEIGRTIGFPTANVVPPPDLIVPKRGAYAAVATLGHQEWPAMVNIGSRPTINTADAPPTIEAHLIGYKGDLYGEKVALGFTARLRDEQPFPSLDALSRQLIADREATLTIINE